MEAAPTCFGLQRNHNQGSTASVDIDYAAIALTSARCLCQHWTNLVILAKHWLWLPDDDFFVNRNLLEQPL